MAAKKQEETKQEPKQEPKKGLITVKILKHVGPYTPGQVVDMTPEEAKSVCTPRERHDGTQLIRTQLAMTLKDFEIMKAAPVDKGGMTQGELAAIGEKNIVETPKDKAFEARLAAIKKGKSVDQIPAVSPAAQARMDAKKDFMQNEGKPGFVETHESDPAVEPETQNEQETA